MRMKLFSKVKLSSAEHEEVMHLNELNSNGAVQAENGTNGTLTIVSNGASNVNGATQTTSGTISEYTETHENAVNAEKNRLEIQLEMKPYKTKQITEKEPESKFTAENYVNIKRAILMQSLQLINIPFDKSVESLFLSFKWSRVTLLSFHRHF